MGHPVRLLFDSPEPRQLSENMADFAERMPQHDVPDCLPLCGTP